MGLARLACIAALLLVPAFAAAEPSAADKETARSLMKQGDAARAGGNLREALKNFEAADSIMHVPTTGLEVAKTRAALGMLIEARELSLQIARSAPQPGEPPPFGEARAAAQKLSEDLEGRIPSVKVSVPGATDVQLTVDGAAVPKALLEFPRKLDPGKHSASVKAAEGSRTVAFELFERESKELVVDLRADEGGPPPTGAGGGEAPAPGRKRSALPMVLFAGGGTLAVAGGIVGAVTGVMSLSQTDQIKKDCGGSTCPSSERSKIDDANTLATIATIALVGAGVGAAVGVTGAVMLFSGKSSNVSVRATMGVGSIGVEGRF